MPEIRRRMQVVATKRAASERKQTKKLADTPATFNVTVIPKRPFLVIPEVSSEQREYIPIAYLNPPIIPSNLVRIIEDATSFLFGILTSRMHMAWLRFIGGRLESRYRYSIGIVYNPFPWPQTNSAAEDSIGKLSDDVLAARAQHQDSTLADLYDATAMPNDLRKAHHALDIAVDKLYRKEPFNGDRERVEFLLARYETARTPLIPPPSTPKKRRRRN
jgi:hypothetical protein